MAGVKGRSGGARPGAGRKPNEIERKHRTVYCNSLEFKGLKNVLTVLKELDKANKRLAKSKGCPRIIRTGILVCFRTPFVTDPRKSPAKAVRPREPITIRSAPSRSASPAI